MLRASSFLVKSTSIGRKQFIGAAKLFSTLRSIRATTQIECSSHFQPKKFLSTKETREFKAETKQLLDIVTNSIYTDKEVFLRELVSNASDALEKLRYKQVQGEVKGIDGPMEISIIADKENKTLTIADNGIGMTKDDLVNNLGIIARSGSKQFVQAMKSDESAPTDPLGIIGQFGVGFYSSFMVADTVTVESISAVDDNKTAHRWSSDGTGEFTIETLDKATEGHTHGTRIIMSIKDKYLEYLDVNTLQTVIKKYSNFVSFPIKLNNTAVNTVSAIWIKDKRDVKPEEYLSFYKFIANAYDEPRFTLHYRTDAPIDLKVLFYVPFTHPEKFGGGQMERGVNLYSRKVLIESKPADLLPSWMRFVKGVVDSEDLPLSISREKPQDSNLLRRIKEVTTRKFIRFLEDQMKENRKGYEEFHLEFNYFLKEGVCSDNKFTEQIAKLLLFETSTLPEFTLTSFDELIARLTPEQKEIYYIVAPSREAALQSPYMELFVKHKKEVLLLYNTIDDFVMGNLRVYGNRKLVSIEKSNINFDEESSAKSDETKAKEGDSTDSTSSSADKSSTASTVRKLSDMEAAEVCGWIKLSLGDKKIAKVKVTHRLSDSPAIVTDHESGSVRKMMKMVQHSSGGVPELPPQTLEINPKHPIIVGIYEAIDMTRSLRTTTTTTTSTVTPEKKNDDVSATATSSSSSSDGIQEAEIVVDNTVTSTVDTAHLAQVESMAKIIAEQLYDNALIAAGLADDARTMLPRLNKILQAAIKK